MLITILFRLKLLTKLQQYKANNKINIKKSYFKFLKTKKFTVCILKNKNIYFLVQTVQICL